MAEMLADGRPFLLGDRFTAADLTFAALAAPVVLPPRYGVRCRRWSSSTTATARVDRGARATRRVRSRCVWSPRSAARSASGQPRVVPPQRDVAPARAQRA